MGIRLKFLTVTLFVIFLCWTNYIVRVLRKSCKEWNFATYLLFDFAKHVSLRRLISVIMELLCQKYLNSHASLLYEISVFTVSSVVLLFIYMLTIPFLVAAVSTEWG